MSSHTKGIQFSLLCLLILGVLPIIAAVRTTEGDAMAFAFWLSFWQLVFAAPVYWLQRRQSADTGAPHSATRKFSQLQTAGLVVLTGVLFGVATFVYVKAVDLAGPVTFAVAVQAYPLFALVWESLFLRRRKSVTELGFMLTIAASMVYLGTQGTWHLASVTSGFWLALVVPFLWSVAHVIIKEMMHADAITPSEVILTRVLIAALLLGVVCLSTQGWGAIQSTGTSLKFQMLALLMGAAYYLELFSWFSAVKHIDVSKAASVTAPAPALTVLLSIMLLGQPLHSYQTIALVLVVGSVMGLIHHGHRQSRAG